jgi:hypothetical protein
VRLVAAAAAACAAIVVTAELSFAAFSNTKSVASNAFTTTTLAAPTGPAATGGANIVLTWTATASTFATGYNILRSQTNGGPYAQLVQVTPRTTVTYTDSPIAGTYYYVLQSYFQNWISVNTAQVTAGVSTNTGLLSCGANAAVTSSAGDNNGFQLNPGNACADDGAFAEDTDSGTGTSTSCTNTGKDRHLFYNYGISVPASSVINGFEVRLDGMADATTGTPLYCVELSWNGGTTWTTAKTSANLTTTEATYTLGTTSDNWGRTWAVSELTNANFRVRITSRASNNSRDFRLEWVAVKVTYTPP